LLCGSAESDDDRHKLACGVGPTMHLKARNPRIFPSRRHGGGWHQRPFPESRPPPALKLAGDRRPCRPCRVPGPEPDATWDHLKRSASPLSLSLEPERRLGHRGLLAGPCKLSLLVCVDNIPLSESYSIRPPTGGAPGPGPDSLWPTREEGQAAFAVLMVDSRVSRLFTPNAEMF
jgi:hypothetical protein